MAILATEWARRLKLTGSAPAATLSGFVACITEANLPDIVFSTAENGGGDLRVCLNPDGSEQLPLEVVKFNSVAKTAVLWVRFPSYSASTRSLWLFYGRSGQSQPLTSSTYGRNAVWSDFEYVFHFSELGRTDDSTGRYNLTENGVLSYTADPIGDGGINGGGSSGNYGTVTGYGGPSGSQSRTHSFWMKTTAGDAGLVEYGQNVNSQRFTARLDWGKLRLEVNGGYRRAESTVLDDGAWHLCVIKANGATALHSAVSMTIDGVAESSYAAAGSPSLNTNPSNDLVFAAPAFGRPSDSQGEQWLRLFETSDELDQLEHANQSDPGSFWTLEVDEETAASSPSLSPVSATSILTSIFRQLVGSYTGLSSALRNETQGTSSLSSVLRNETQGNSSLSSVLRNETQGNSSLSSVLRNETQRTSSLSLSVRQVILNASTVETGLRNQFSGTSFVSTVFRAPVVGTDALTATLRSQISGTQALATDLRSNVESLSELTVSLTESLVVTSYSSLSVQILAYVQRTSQTGASLRGSVSESSPIGANLRASFTEKTSTEASLRGSLTNYSQIDGSLRGLFQTSEVFELSLRGQTQKVSDLSVILGVTTFGSATIRHTLTEKRLASILNEDGLQAHLPEWSLRITL